MPAFFISASALAARSLAAALARSKKLMADSPSVWTALPETLGRLCAVAPSVCATADIAPVRGPTRRWRRPMTIHGSLFQEFKEKDTQDPFALQNKKMLRIDMRYGEVWARTGSMVAYQGDVRFANKGSGGLGKMLKAATTGEGVKMMQCSGSGELFVADFASEIQVMYLENDAISVNGANVLAFSQLDRVGHPPHPGPRGHDDRRPLQRRAARHRLRRRHHQGRPGRPRRRVGTDLRRRPGRGAVDGRGVDGHPGRHRRPRRRWCVAAPASCCRWPSVARATCSCSPASRCTQGGHQSQSPGGVLGGFLQ